MRDAKTKKKIDLADVAKYDALIYQLIDNVDRHARDGWKLNSYTCAALAVLTAAIAVGTSDPLWARMFLAVAAIRWATLAFDSYLQARKFDVFAEKADREMAAELELDDLGTRA